MYIGFNLPIKHFWNKTSNVYVSFLPKHLLTEIFYKEIIKDVHKYLSVKIFIQALVIIVLPCLSLTLEAPCQPLEWNKVSSGIRPQGIWPPWSHLIMSGRTRYPDVGSLLSLSLLPFISLGMSGFLRATGRQSSGPAAAPAAHASTRPTISWCSSGWKPSMW